MKLINHKLKDIFDCSTIDKTIIRFSDLDKQNVICKFYLPYSSKIWVVFAGEKYLNNDYRFFGAIHSGTEKTIGYFRLSELKKLKGSNGERVVRDENIFNQPYFNLY